MFINNVTIIILLVSKAHKEGVAKWDDVPITSCSYRTCGLDLVYVRHIDSTFFKVITTQKA